MASGVQKGYLALADISGYTRFMAETELDHSQGIMAAFFNTLIRHLTPRMQLAEVEGDALFLYAPIQQMSRGETLMELIESAYVDFRRLQLTMVRNADCPCTACAGIASLDLKFVAHYGEFALQEYAGKSKPVGSSVNLVHRLLKNNVREAKGWHGYALFTNTALERMDVYPLNTFEQTQNYEHFGDVVTYSSNLDERYRELMEQKPLSLTREEADVWKSFRLDAPPSLVWEFLNDPGRRLGWMKGSAWHSIERPGGRTGRGSKNHCSNSDVIEHVLDWRPFDRCTVRFEKKFFRALMVNELKPDGEGTLVEWQLKLDLPIPRPLRVPMAKFVASRVMDWEGRVEALGKSLQSALSEQESRPTATAGASPPAA